MVCDWHVKEISVYSIIFASEHYSYIHGVILGGREVSKISGAYRYHHFNLLDFVAGLLHLPLPESAARSSCE